MRVRVLMAGATNKGRHRKTNQDSIYFDEQLQVGIVADGIGGRKGGDIASSMAVNNLRKLLLEIETLRHEDVQAFLVSAIDKVNLAILDRGEHDPLIAGMGTTLNCLLFAGERIYLAHIGDSRTYLAYKDHFWQLTIDHNVENFLERAWLRRENLQPGWKGSALMRALGLAPHCEVDVYQKLVRPGEVYLAASDGLFDMLRDHEIAQIVSHYQNDHLRLPQILIREANRKGGRDNITVFIAKVVE